MKVYIELTSLSTFDPTTIKGEYTGSYDSIYNYVMNLLETMRQIEPMRPTENKENKVTS